MKEGDRIELVYTDDPYTKLKPGDQGTVTGFGETPYERQVHVRWDNGSTLSMLVGHDEFKIIEEKENS
jgi:hypothetical protein